MDLVKLGKLTEKVLNSYGKGTKLLVEDCRMRGLKTCDECGRYINMGYFTLTHFEHGSIIIPFIALHSMTAHNTSVYSGSHNQGVIDVECLKRILGVE